MPAREQHISVHNPGFPAAFLQNLGGLPTLREVLDLVWFPTNSQHKIAGGRLYHSSTKQGQWPPTAYDTVAVGGRSTPRNASGATRSKQWTGKQAIVLFLADDLAGCSVRLPCFLSSLLKRTLYPLLDLVDLHLLQSHCYRAI